MKCIKCGAELKSNAKFCKYCGTQSYVNISEKSEYQSMNQHKGVNTNDFIKCRNCGELVRTDNKFCINCGVPLVEIENVGSKENKKNPSEKKEKRLTVFIASTLVIAAILDV